MNRDAAKIVRSAYLARYSDLVHAEPVKDAPGGSVAISVPLRIVGGSSVEFQVLEGSRNTFILSDAGRTVQELQLAGYALSGSLMPKIGLVVETMGAKVGGHSIVMECRSDQLGDSIQLFADIIKTVGDFYLALRPPSDPQRSAVVGRVRGLLAENGAHFQEEARLPGRVDQHRIDFFIQRNGHKAWAIEALGGQDTHSQAMIWDFRCRDIRAANSGLQIGIVFDDEEGAWSERSRKILRAAADVSIPASSISGSLFGVDIWPFRARR